MAGIHDRGEGDGWGEGRGERISNRTMAGPSWNIPSLEGSSKILDKVSEAHIKDKGGRDGEDSAIRSLPGIPEVPVS